MTTKRTLALIVAVVVVGTVASFSAARWRALRAASVTPARVHDARWLQRDLQLSESQVVAVERFAGQFQTELDRLCAAHCAARFALGDELAKPTVDREKASRCVEKMNAAQAEAERATLDHILKVRALLTEDQAQRYASVIHQQVCSMPMGTPY